MALIAKGVLSSRIANYIESQRVSREDLQEVLVSIAYQAALGNPNWANELLAKVQAIRSVHLKPLTMWLETYAPLIIRKEQFEINKGMAKTMHVTDEASFAEYEREMRKVKWWEMVAPQKPKSIFDAAEYSVEALERAAKKLDDNGQPDLANVMRGFIKELATNEVYKAVVAKAMAEA